ncbi:AraC family transcriptional regulator [Amycolatopsis jejuensis]|uniref:AraC family transcriptional regulator n=1 Tax=Amycolatopsis jejuensis TaxID=330084 RepID=UPI0007C464E1|nr:AraC family transcriptional regulator [Amycolatopsis jejuensis]
MRSRSAGQVDTADPDEAVARLSDVYCPHRLRLVGGGTGFRAHQTGGGLPELQLYDVGYGSCEVIVEPEPFDDFILVSRPLSGRFAVRSAQEGAVATTHEAVVMDAYGAYQMQWKDGCRVAHLVVNRAALERVAAELAGFDEPAAVRFQLSLPQSASVGRAWSSVTGFLREQLTPSGEVLGPLARAQLLRFTAAALLDAYPTSLRKSDAPRAGLATPATLRRAIAYIEHHADEPIGLLEIAHAARLSPRGLQAVFQRYEGTAPLAYLRHTRLLRAHAELKTADPERTTVASVAVRWGFVNLGRFAAEHRKLYGCSPREVLGIAAPPAPRSNKEGR